MYNYNIFFSHPSVTGYLGYFHVLSIVNSVAVDVGVHVSFTIIVSSGYICPGVGLLDPVATLVVV